MTYSQLGKGASARGWWKVGVVALLTIAGCVSEPLSEQKPSVGIAKLALTGSSTSGAIYRLRDGVIELNGPESKVVSTERDLDASSILVTLIAGDYEADLKVLWYLEKFDPTSMTWGRVAADLLTPLPLSFFVIEDSTTGIVFEFRSDGEIIEMKPGEVNITIAVDDSPRPATNCREVCRDAAVLECASHDECPKFCNADERIDERCKPFAIEYVDCRAGIPGSEYSCIADVPIPMVCQDEFVQIRKCLSRLD
jgi:hypothetical protein